MHRVVTSCLLSSPSIEYCTQFHVFSFFKRIYFTLMYTRLWIPHYYMTWAQWHSPVTPSLTRWR